MVNIFLGANKLKFEDISHIFVNQGPGNFSGLRSSLSTAKGISMAKNLNIDLSKRPEELNNEMFYKIAMQYEKLFD